jgi:hypothetical protein
MLPCGKSIYHRVGIRSSLPIPEMSARPRAVGNEGQVHSREKRTAAVFECSISVRHGLPP